MIQPRVIFVFGSNEAGQHLGGAARDALRFWGARFGVGEGPQGEAYAIPTLDRQMRHRALIDIATSIGAFLLYAIANPERTFYVTPIGCGIAGFKAEEIAPMFAHAPANVQLPDGWRELAQAVPA